MSHGFGPGYACASCRTSLRPRKNDIDVVVEDGEGKPWRLWSADLWECPSCGARSILGFGAHHYAEHYEADFDDVLARVEKRGHVHWIQGRLQGLPDDRVDTVAMHVSMDELEAPHPNEVGYIGDPDNGVVQLDGCFSPKMLRILAAWLEAQP